MPQTQTTPATRAPEAARAHSQSIAARFEYATTPEGLARQAAEHKKAIDRLVALTPRAPPAAWPWDPDDVREKARALTAAYNERFKAIDRDIDTLVYELIVIDLGGPLPISRARRADPRYLKWSPSRIAWARIDYGDWQTKWVSDRALAATSAVLSRTIDLASEVDRADYNKTLASIEYTYPLTGEDRENADYGKPWFDPLEQDKWNLQWNERRRQETSIEKEHQEQQAERKAGVDARLGILKQIYSNRQDDPPAALAALHGGLQLLAKHDPELAHACAFKLMAFLSRLGWSAEVVVNAGIAAGVGRDKVEPWVRQKLFKNT